ncbi:Cytochrome P450, putative isoform 2 [Hibiscus syriacus]|uniref:Cytochrome P450, putative isoform 2 n=1 Tax=Hibiscus syriacus TaxID=106335 RepID=A0A6A3CI20_HIBSY|nr:cucurbitadienol 11-hydroxylase-like [Hibiscus syriacus]KAE8729065.1 Cytochrome P450, putative isoform 2 [Hibiscus syriacus]
MMMMSGWFFAISILVISISETIRWIYRWRNPKCKGILPPGSMGLPLLGETLSFIVTANSIDIHPFVRKRMNRYGPLFKTSIAGRSIVVSTDPDFNDFVFRQEGKLVEMWYMDSFAKLLRQDTTAASGHVHKYLRHLVMSHFGVETLKTRLLPQLECAINRGLQEWAKQPNVQLKDQTAAMIFEFTAKHMLSYDPERSSDDNIVGNLSNFLEGLMSFPLRIPGTAFYRCRQRQQKVMKVISKIVEERMKRSNSQGDFVDEMVEDMRTETFMTKEFASHVLFGILLASFETISSTVALAINYLSEHPSLLQQLTEEHEEILNKRRGGNPGGTDGLVWEDYRSMNFTHDVVNESLRLANVAPGILRRVIKDIHVNGYTIPRGWAIMVVSAAQHLNPNTFEDPLTFDPSRWKNTGSNAKAKNFMAFGGGGRTCAGADFSKVLMAVFLHVLVTKYRWTKIKGGDVVRSPTLGFADGFYVSVSPKHASNIEE